MYSSLSVERQVLKISSNIMRNLFFFCSVVSPIGRCTFSAAPAACVDDVDGKLAAAVDVEAKLLVPDVDGMSRDVDGAANMLVPAMLDSALDEL